MNNLFTFVLGDIYIYIYTYTHVFSQVYSIDLPKTNVK
jgi:hypothetical protein